MTATASSSSPAPELDRPGQIQAFLSRVGWDNAVITNMRPDASVRRYMRLVRPDGQTAILMDARPPMEDTVKFEYMAQKFRRLGFSVPDIFDADHAQGLVLMEDFGDDTFFVLINTRGMDAEPLLSLAVDALIHKAKADPAVALEGCVAYSDEYWLYRIEQYLTFYKPHIDHETVPDEVKNNYLALFKDALDRAHVLPNILLHGDYGLQNFMYLPDRPGIQALGLLDFQDMTDARGNMSGSPAFDLMFLLRDVRAHYDEDLITRLVDRFVHETGITDRVQFDYECAAIVAAQSAKCLGLFARFGVVNNRPEYLPFLQNCWRNLHWAFRHPGLADLKAWFQEFGGMKQDAIPA